MFFRIQIARLGRNGVPLGTPTKFELPSQSEAIQVVRRAIELAGPLRQPMQFHIFDPDDRLVMSYSTSAGSMNEETQTI